MANDTTMISIITEAKHLTPEDRDFLVSSLPNLNMLEKLKLRQVLESDGVPPQIHDFHKSRASFIKKETPQKSDPVSSFIQKVIPQKPKQPVHKGILSNSRILGSNPVQPITIQPAQPIQQITQLQSLNQLVGLQNSHITFNLQENSEQSLRTFFATTSQLFEAIPSIDEKRSYFLAYMQSPLFKNYMNTGLTALRHPEMKPAKIILNLLFQINPNYLNTRQFETAARITDHLRTLVGLA